ncbi:NFAT activation molecule 1 [Molossus nigricans]
MESWAPLRWAPPGPVTASWLLGLLLSPETLQLTGGQSVTHTGPPILVSLANNVASFNCSITYLYTPEFKTFTVSYSYVNLQGQKSVEEQTGCQPTAGPENQTHTTVCRVIPRLPNAAATGTYYCTAHWPRLIMSGAGPFILVRDTGYREPPRHPRRVLFFCFIGLLSVLSVLGTALLLWKKKQVQASWKNLARKGPAPSTAVPEQPPAESLYTALQRRETEVYASMQNEASSLPSSGTFLSQEKQRGVQNDSEFNLVYENL